MSNFYKDFNNDYANRTTRVLENLADIRRDYEGNNSSSHKDKEQGDEATMNHSSGKINFRNNKRKTKIKAALKGVAFVLIASFQEYYSNNTN